MAGVTIEQPPLRVRYGHAAYAEPVGHVAGLVSVVTAVHEASVVFLAQAYRSLVEQELPPGWQWEWLVQQDGSGTAAGVLPDDPRVTVDSGRRGGPATTRNLAAGRAQGSLVKVLDADDQLTPGALGRDIAVLAYEPTIGWTTASALDLWPDGSTVGWQHRDPPAGRLARNHVLHSFQQHDYRLPVHPATLCIRRDLLLALGGWMALPGGEDTGLLLAASVVSDGYFIGAPGLLYRRHAGQVTGRAGWTGSTEWTARMRFVEARAIALQALWRHADRPGQA